MGDYYDLQAILAEDERVPVVFNTGASGIGRALDPSCDDDDLAKGATVDLPTWMIGTLASRNMISVRLPRWYDERVRRELEADAGCVDLGQKCAFYYEVGLKVTLVLREPTLPALLLSAFQGRYKDLLTKAHHASDSDMAVYKKILTREELQLFELGRESMRGFTSWRLGYGNKLKMASILGRKRRSRRFHPWSEGTEGKARSPLSSLNENLRR